MSPELLSLLDIIAKGGAALTPFLAYLWFDERRERRELQKEAVAVTRDTTKALLEASNGVDRLSDVVSEMNKTQTQMATVVLQTRGV